MPKVGLSSIIDKSFLNSFLGMAQGKSSSNSLAAALNGGQASKVSISDGLRLGARAFGTAVQNLNSLTNYVGLSEGTLVRLSDLTDDLISYTEKATKSSTGFAARKRLMVDFQSTAREFKKIISEAKIGERELLKAGDLEELFLTLGLDRESSESVADLFSQFVLGGEDGLLVDEEAKGKGFAKIPASAFVGPTQQVSVAAYTEQSVSNGVVQNSSITSTGGVSLNGSSASFVDNGVTTQLEGVDALFSTDQFSNYSVISSRSDYSGYNASGLSQLFLVDGSGQVLQQLTNNQDSTVNFQSAEASSDGSIFGYTASNSSGSYLAVRDIGGLGIDPAVGNTVYFEQSSSEYSEFKISSDGSHFAYKELDESEDSHVALRNTETQEINNSLYQQTNRYEEIDFIDSNELVLSRKSGSSYDIISYSYNSSSTVLTSGLESVKGLTAVEESLTTNSDYYYAFINESEQSIDLYRKGRGIAARTSYEGTNLESVSLSVTTSGTEAVAIGFQGGGETLSGGLNSHLYALQESGTDTLSIPTRLAAATQKTGDVLNSARKLLRKPDAHRLLHDLKGLKDQLETNIEALGDARELIGSNIELVRSAGFAFLNISDQIGTEQEADSVARLLRKEIRNAPSKALAQAENLQDIAVAALTVDEEKTGLDS